MKLSFRTLSELHEHPELKHVKTLQVWQNQDQNPNPNLNLNQDQNPNPKQNPKLSLEEKLYESTEMV